MLDISFIILKCGLLSQEIHVECASQTLLNTNPFFCSFIFWLLKSEECFMQQSGMGLVIDCLNVDFGEVDCQEGSLRSLMCGCYYNACGD